MRTTTLFKNGRTQAVRLPKEFAFKGVTSVEIYKEGDAVILRPARKTWESFIELVEHSNVPDDFMADRDNEPPQERGAL